MRIVLLSLPATWSSSAGKVVQAFDADWFVLFRKLLERHFSAECETVVYKLTVSVVCRSLTWGGLCALWFRWWHTLTLGVIGCVRPAPHVKLAVAAGLVPVLMKHSCLHKPGPPAQRLLQTLERDSACVGVVCCHGGVVQLKCALCTPTQATAFTRVPMHGGPFQHRRRGSHRTLRGVGFTLTRPRQLQELPCSAWHGRTPCPLLPQCRPTSARNTTTVCGRTATACTFASQRHCTSRICVDAPNCTPLTQVWYRSGPNSAPDMGGTDDAVTKPSSPSPQPQHHGDASSFSVLGSFAAMLTSHDGELGAHHATLLQSLATMLQTRQDT